MKIMLIEKPLFRVFFLLFLLNGLINPASAQGKSNKNDVTFLKSHDGIVYINNTPGAYFTIDIPGDTLINIGIKDGFQVGSTIYHAVLNSYKNSEYNYLRRDSMDEFAVLEGKMNWELDYISGEVFKENVKSGYEVFKNKDGKNYFLWHYISPAGKKHSDDILVVEQYYLTFIANKYVAGISTPLFENEIREDKVRMLKDLADRIDVFGAKVDIDALYYKLGSRAVGKDLQYDDSLNGYVLSVPDWFNIVESTSDNAFIGTLPDIDNIQNAIMVQKFKKSEFKSFAKFNEEVIPTNRKIGSEMKTGIFLERRDLDKPKNVNGISVKISLKNFSGFYEVHYITIETAYSYLKIMFTATPATFALNHPRFIEFVEAMEIIE